MFIRASSQLDKKTGRTYTTHRLVESYRNLSGQVRQRTLLNLGTHFDFPKEIWKTLADRVEDILHGQASLFSLNKRAEKEAQRIAKQVTQKYSFSEIQRIPNSKTKQPTDYQTVDIDSMAHQDIRKIGSEHVGHQAACQLQLSQLLSSLGFNQKQNQIALGSIITRLVHPGSELNTHQYLSQQSALDELLGTDFSTLKLESLYRISDQLFKHKEAIEKALYKKEKDLFCFEEVVTLYDITNTYFEGRCLSHSKAKHGRSKEKRSDCPLVSLGLVLDASGFPKKSHIFPGNVSEPKTLQEMLERLEANKKATIVMDAGIATKDNIEWLKSSEYEYIVVSRKSDLVMPEGKDAVVVKKSKYNNVIEVQAALIKNEETDELELYCHSQAKAAKTKQMVTKAEAKFELELNKLSQGLSKKGCTKKYDKIVERVGRLKERHNKVGKNYEISIEADSDKNKAVTLTWEKKKDADHNLFGIYCLRTNRKDLDEQTFWKTYTMLTEVEAAFRSLKSELGFRPVYHQKECRIDAHLFISIIAYHLLHTIRHQLKMKGIHESWKSLREILDTHCRITTSLQLKNGQTVRVRKTSSPDENQASIYNALNISTQPGKIEKTYF